ncbi:phosphatidylinositol glycan, class B [Angomonas deanei]|nr:phosphatidylinositol glycan, class B [Angomonas deanei]|eukprot:EPY18195.1 phosphatidylinositol glycan, class B [Angomonas deanei]
MSAQLVRRWFPFFFLLRLCIAVSMTSHEAPDEWWQGPEVAYHFVFGKGTLTWEWSPEVALRSVLFPLCFAVPYWVLARLGLDSAVSLFLSEKTVQAVVAAGVDCCTVCLAGRLERKRSSSKKGSRLSRVWCPTTLTGTTALLQATSFYIAYCGGRTYSNIMETWFVLLAMLQEGSYGLFLLFSGLACIIRPTAAVALLPCVYRHWKAQLSSRGGCRTLLRLLTLSLVAVVLLVGGSAVLDRAVHYPTYVLTPYNFLYVNVVRNVSSLYGVHPWWFYFVVAFPALAGFSLVWLCLPLFLRVTTTKTTMYDTLNAKEKTEVKFLLFSMVWVMAFYSLLAHKEIRFIFVVGPLSSVLAAVSLHTALQQQGPLLLTLPALSRPVGKSLLRRVLVGCLLANLALFTFVGYYWQSGSNRLFRHIRWEQGDVRYDQLHILTNCYETPGYAALHGRVGELDTVSCDLKYNTTTGRAERTERDYFMQAPAPFIRWKYDRNRQLRGQPLPTADDSEAWWKGVEALYPSGEDGRPLPDGIVIFSDVALLLQEEFLSKHHYRLKYAAHDKPFAPQLQLWVR